MKSLGHRFFRDVLCRHLLFDLPGDDALDRNRLDLLKDAFFLQERIEARSGVAIMLFHHFNPCSCVAFRVAAMALSEGGVCWLFLMKPCRSTIRCRAST